MGAGGQKPDCSGEKLNLKRERVKARRRCTGEPGQEQMLRVETIREQVLLGQGVPLSTSNSESHQEMQSFLQES